MLIKSSHPHNYIARVEKLPDGRVARYAWRNNAIEALLEWSLGEVESTIQDPENRGYSLLPLTLETLSVGDEVKDGDGDVQRVLTAQGVGKYRTYVLGYFGDHSRFLSYRTAHDLAREGYTPVPWESSSETIDIAGKKYNKSEVEERIQELKPVE